MKKIFTSICLAVCFVAAFAQTAKVSGPNGKLQVQFEIKAGVPQYNVIYDGVQVIENSPLGFVANMGDYASGIQFVKAEDVVKVEKTYEMNRSKRRFCEYKANELRINLKNSKGGEFAVLFQVADNDIAFRYEIKPLKETKAFRMMEEKTAFDFPDGTTTFLTPQSDAMIGWKRTKPSYEEEYKVDAQMTDRSQYGHGYTFPCLFKVNGGSRWVLVSETGNDSHFCGCRLSDYQPEGYYKVELPMVEENNGNGTIQPAFALPGETPWRTITVGSTLAPIVETTIPFDVVEPLYEPSRDYQFGRGTWSWIVWQDNSINYDDQVRYINLAKAMGFEYVLIDNYWDTNIGKESVERLVQYAQSQGVDVFLWFSSSGYWNDITQGPIDRMDNPIVRKKWMKWMKDLGVKGIKVDFFGGDKQETFRLYEQILSDADDYGLMVIFHGCTLPRGWERMYPNYVGSEAVLASENIYFSQHFADKESFNACLHPFIRNAVGCMEFGGCFMNRQIHKGNKGGNTRRTTDCFELATTVLFQNPIQNFAITPENLEDEKEGGAPKVSMDLLREIPTTWEKTVFIDGYPGKFVVIARQHHSSWYVVGVNATGETLKLNLNLSAFVERGDKVRLYSDNLKNQDPDYDAKKNVTTPEAFPVTMAKDGGFVLIK